MKNVELTTLLKIARSWLRSMHSWTLCREDSVHRTTRTLTPTIRVGETTKISVGGIIRILLDFKALNTNLREEKILRRNVGEVYGAHRSVYEKDRRWPAEPASLIRNLKTLVGQLAQSVSHRPQGTLLSTTENNPREQVQAITTRSGVQLPEIHVKRPSVDKGNEVIDEESEHPTQVEPPAAKHVGNH